jgi:hypothetical protein
MGDARSHPPAENHLQDVRLSDIEPRFTCRACGHRGADVRPDFGWEKKRSDARRFSGFDGLF